MQSLFWRAGCAAAVILSGMIVSGVALADCAPPYSASANATYYTVGSSGACSLANVDGETTAITSRRWMGSAHCGECLQVTGPLGTTIVKVTDECPDCTHSDLDMSQGAFAKIGALPDGVIPISWQRVDCPVSGGLKLQVQEGVNPYYLSFLADATRQGVTALRIKQNGSATWETTTRLDYGYFNITSATGLQFPLAVEATSESGEVLQMANAIPNATPAVTYARAEQFGACADRVFANDFGSTQ
jgi:expansin (peptidoglycan-binding protein)